ncbi:Hsp20/alpha crystallin family protein [Photobacterium lipolyticum]|uniref:Hsp20/alpha crystallin family protein n=1 Tax=Photobacterium lipolyticum TaxID=266810 RepID=A0A2T3N4N6_9GAMM|nr:Hsp20/alpha crystallin family protein [Photobacterium lipolyticum]PSW07380.1 Hsp20/alpha crystallin family protein [Photobacterium lipolyticum]
MNIVPRNPWRDLFHMFDDIESAFPMLRQTLSAETMTPRVDIVENEDNFEISAELPGVNKEDVSLQIENGSLIIKASTQQEVEEKEGGRIIRQERHIGKFMRSFYVGQDTKQEDIQAEFHNGLLKIQVPKLESSKPQPIQIEVK